MTDTFKNSYKVKEKETVSLSVYNVGFQKCEPRYQWGPGVRDHYLIHYIVSGKGIYAVKGQTYTLEAGDIFLVYPFQEMTYYADSEDPWEYYWVGFSGSDASAILCATDLSKEMPVIHSCTFGAAVKEYLYAIYEARGNSIANAAEMTGWLYLTLSLFIRGAVNKKLRSDSYITYVQKAVEYVASNYSYPISVEDMAGYAGVSRSHLYRAFLQHMDKSPKEYLSDFRIKQACQLLKHSNLSISAIANSVGFEDSLYFSKVFHKKKGMPPSEYAKNK